MGTVQRLVRVIVISLALLILACPYTAHAQTQKSSIAWKDALKQAPEWYRGDNALRIADNVLLYQRESGGWPKNIDMAKSLDAEEQAQLLKEKQHTDSTIDNGATYTQLMFLARVYDATKYSRHRDAFFRGVDYLLRAQYANGGWPQFYPNLSGYYKRITFNDDAMIGVMNLLRDIAEGKTEYKFVDSRRRGQATRAIRRGLACILKTQVTVGGRLTVWGSQYDEIALVPAAARTFEPVSLVSAESVGIVRYLMRLPHPTPKIVAAIEGGIDWFETSKLMGIKWVSRSDATSPNGFDRVVVKENGAGPLWARFYEIGTNRPIFAGRDSVVRYDVAEIESERRNGYQWYVETPAKLLAEDYPKWHRKLMSNRRFHKSGTRLTTPIQ